MRLIATIQGCSITEDDEGRVYFTADADIDADGSIRAYHPNSRLGLDDLSNAGGPGNWYGIVTDDSGKPIIQGPTDPAPGYYVSPTSYQWPQFDKTDPRRYLDSESIPFCVVGNPIRHGVKGTVLGCKARMTNLRNGKVVKGMVGDMGPAKKIGELSIAAAKALGIPSSPRTGGEEDRVIKYELWPGVPAVIDGIDYPLIRG